MMQFQLKYPCGSRRSTASTRWHPAQLAFVVALVLGGDRASACTSINPSDSASRSSIVNNTLRADAQLTSWKMAGSGAGFLNCGAWPTATLTFRPNMHGLSYVRNVTIERISYPAYQWSPTSPLIIMQLRSRPEEHGGSEGEPVRIDQDVSVRTDTHPGTTVHAYLRYMLLARGTPMSRPPPLTIAGATSHNRYPGLGSVIHDLDIQVDVKQLTCTLSDASIVLDDVTGADLPAVGANTGLKALHPVIDCPPYGPGVHLTLRDAGDSSNTGSLLKPAAGSTATGVQVEILREGKPVQFGQAWEFPVRDTGGRQTIYLLARYARTGSLLSPGIVNGKAIITATYN